MAEEYRVPVLEVVAVLHTGDGQRHAVTLFLPPGRPIAELLAGPDPFFGAREDGQFRLFGRKSLACLETSCAGKESMSDETSGLPLSQKHLRVRLRQGGVVSGCVRFVPYQQISRTVDVLNQPEPTFALIDGERILYIVKEQVESVEEL